MSRKLGSPGRLRAARYALLIGVVILASIVGGIVLKGRGRPRALSEPSTAAGSEARQTLEKFRFTSTVAGKRLYSIEADRLLSGDRGEQSVEGVRSIEIARDDGRIVRGSADRGAYGAAAADADSGAGRGLALDGSVRLEGPDGDLFESDRVEYDPASRLLVSPGRCRFRMVLHGGAGEPASQSRTGAPSDHASERVDDRPPGATIVSGESDSLAYAIDGRRLELTGAVSALIRRPGSPELVVRADRASVDPASESVDLTGSVLAERGGDWLKGSKVSIARDKKAGTYRIIAGPRAETRYSPPPVRYARGASQATPPSASRLGLKADRMEILENTSDRSRRLQLSGSAALWEEAKPGSAARLIRADILTLQDAGPGTPTSLRASGQVTALAPPGQGRTGLFRIDCGSLEAVITPEGGMVSGEAARSVRISEGDRRGFAERARMLGPHRFELRGSRPRVEDPGAIVVADEVDLDFGAQTLDARGAVRARLLPAPSARGGWLARDEPIEIASETAFFRQAERKAEFKGSVIARQEGDALSAASLIVDDAARSIRADGSVLLRSTRSEDEGRMVPSHAEADSLVHDAGRGTTLLEGRARYREPGRDLSAARILLVDDGAARPSEIQATGDVTYSGDGGRARSDKATYRVPERILILEGVGRPAELVETDSGRLWRGPSLSWRLAAGSVPVITGDAGRSIVAGSVERARGENLGNAPERRAPR